MSQVRHAIAANGAARNAPASCLRRAWLIAPLPDKLAKKSNLEYPLLGRLPPFSRRRDAVLPCRRPMLFRRLDSCDDNGT
jgi:hypothetical protein